MLEVTKGTQGKKQSWKEKKKNFAYEQVVSYVVVTTQFIHSRDIFTREMLENTHYVPL